MFRKFTFISVVRYEVEMSLPSEVNRARKDDVTPQGIMGFIDDWDFVYIDAQHDVVLHAFSLLKS